MYLRFVQKGLLASNEPGSLFKKTYLYRYVVLNRILASIHSSLKSWKKCRYGKILLDTHFLHLDFSKIAVDTENLPIISLSLCHFLFIFALLNSSFHDKYNDMKNSLSMKNVGTQFLNQDGSN